MIYVCPICNEQSFSAETAMRRHFLSCWKEKNPCYGTKTASRNEQVVSYNMSNDVLDFFNSFSKGE